MGVWRLCVRSYDVKQGNIWVLLKSPGKGCFFAVSCFPKHKRLGGWFLGHAVLQVCSARGKLHHISDCWAVTVLLDTLSSCGCCCPLLWAPEGTLPLVSLFPEWRRRFHWLSRAELRPALWISVRMYGKMGKGRCKAHHRTTPKRSRFRFKPRLPFS